MAFVVNFPLFAVVLCLICSVVSSVLPGRAARRLSLSLCALVAIGAALLLWYGVRTGAATTYLMGHYPHPWGNELYFGILEPLLLCVFAIVMGLCLLGGRKHLSEDLEDGKHRLYYVMSDLVLSALIVLCCTNDLFTGYVFIEICTISSCGLLMIRQIGRTTLASIRYMIFSLIGSGLFLLGVILLYAITGHLLMPNLKEAIGALYESGSYRIVLLSAISLITVGLAIKSGLFPFHFWMPDTYGYATPASGGILSGIVSKGYIFFLLRVIFRVFGTNVFYRSGVSNVLYVFGAIGIVVGSISALREKDVFRMIAYSSAAQIGYIYMGISLSPHLGVLAALFHILTHAFTKPPLFLSSAQLADVSGSRKRGDWRGAGHKNRLAALTFSICAFSMIGIPLTMGFVSKYRFAAAAFERASLLVPTLIVLALSTILNGWYFMRVVIALYMPAAEADAPRAKPGDRGVYAVSAIVFICLNIICGVAAEPLVLLLERGLALL